MSITIGTPYSPELNRSVERLRENLLDISNRSRLLNFHHRDAARSHIRVIDELPEFLFQKLTGGGLFRIKPLPQPPVRRDADGNELPAPAWQEVARTNGIDPSFELPEPAPSAAARHTDNAIQVPHFPVVTERKMDGIRQEYRTFMEERGIPALFAAFGFLEWRESPDKDSQLAPLVLVPLELDKSREGYGYAFKVRATGEDPEINLSLQLRLKRMGVALPELGEEQDEATSPLAAYFEAVRCAISGMAGWRVRRFVTIGIFQFARQVMYQDLEPQRWAQVAGPGNHPLVAQMLGVRPSGRAAAPAPLERFEGHLITEADGTQTAAIAQALAGVSMVIQGPPGTGKSQTITNLIAAALGEGKTVLFVAEKMAALEVVKKRLDDAGLGEFCLELHSTKAKKRDVLEALHRAYESRAATGGLRVSKTAERDREQALEQLRAYEQAMATRVGALGRTVRELAWNVQEVRDRVGGQIPARLFDLRMTAAGAITEQDLRRDRATLAHLQGLWWAVADSDGRTRNHPWRFVRRGDLSLEQQDAVVSAVKQWAQALEALVAAAQSLPWNAAALGRTALEQTVAGLRALPGTLDADPGLVVRLRPEASLSAAVLFAADLQGYQSCRDQVRSRTRDVVATARAADAVAALEANGVAEFPATSTLREIAEGIPVRREELAELERAADAVERVISRAAPQGAVGKSSPVDVRAVLELVGCIRGGADDIPLRTPKTVSARHLGDYQALAAEVAELRRQREEHDRAYPGWAERTPEDLREDAMVLRTTGWFGRVFGGRYKRARTGYLRLTSGRSDQPQAMADVLQRLAALHDECNRWVTSPRVVELAGPFHQGLGTAFEALAGCARWAEESRARLRELGHHARWTEMVLLTAPEETLREIDLTVTPRHVELLAKWLQGAAGHDLRRSVSTSRQRLDATQTALEDVLAAAIEDRCRLSELPALKGMIDEMNARRAAVEASDVPKALLAPAWAGADADPAPLVRAIAFRQALGAAGLEADVAAYLYQDLPARLGVVKALAEQVVAALADEQRAQQYAAGVGIDVDRVHGIGPPRQAVALLRTAVGAQEHLPSWVAFRAAWGAAEEAPGAREFLNGLDWSEIPPENLADEYELAVFRTLCSTAQSAFGAAAQLGWNANALEKALVEFVDADRRVLEAQRTALRRKLARCDVPEGKSARSRSTELALIRHEAQKKTKHVPIRTLMAQARDAVLGLKPCLMMSPLSVAQYLESDRTPFDMVVIDEASQMKPEDAIGALLRGRQVIVVGDNKQLPPTSFFDRDHGDDEVEDEDDDVAVMDSILDSMLGVDAPKCDLRWHYRSRHHSLIQYSNRQFYQGRLNVFPSPLPRTDGLGVCWRLVQGCYSGSVNEPEAEAVVDAALEFMRVSPGRSLGIVAMNQKQATLIAELIDERLKETDPGFRDKWKDTLEPFFVKNLENVQGDERDVIFVSLTYGPDRNGRVYQRFGPVNASGGERRLNVLFTRAKLQLMLFSSMSPTDVQAGDGAKAGVKALRRYLEYASRPEDTDGAGGTTEVPVDLPAGLRYLGAMLGEREVDVEWDVGSGAMVVPAAVRRGDRTGGYACALELDADLPSAMASSEYRDRLRLRPALLKGLGWKEVKVWSGDWLRDDTRARQLLLGAVEAQVGKKLERCVVPVSAPPTPVRESSSREAADAAPAPNGGSAVVALDQAADAAAYGAEKPTDAAPGQSRGAVLLKRVKSSAHFFEARQRPKWETLVLPLVQLLAPEGAAPVHAVAEALGFPRFRVQGVIAEVQGYLNVGQHEVLRFNRASQQVQLDVELLEQLTAERAAVG